MNLMPKDVPIVEEKIATEPKPNKKSFLLIALVLAFVFLAIIILWRFYFSRSLSSVDVNFSSEPPTCNSKPIPSGKQVFNSSYGKKVLGPKPSQTIIDPLDPKIGGKQTISVSIKNPTPVLKATATLETNKAVNVINQPMELSSGTPTDGVWTTTWTMPGKYDCFYQIKFLIQSGDKKEDIYQGGLSIR